MDIFGYQNQGHKYELFRPKYPPSLIQQALLAAKCRNRFLDIATGTGQLLFALAEHFQFSKGIDVSPKMLQNSQLKLEKYLLKHPAVNIALQLGDGLQLVQKDYDLITIGQALHFIPQRQLLGHMARLLSPNGSMAVFGYVLKAVQSQNAGEGELFNKFYRQVKPLFSFDREDLHTHYEDTKKYPFSEYFAVVKRGKQQETLCMPKDSYVGYLKTMSGYNLFLQQNPGADPLEEIVVHGAEQVTCLFVYFYILCSQK